MNRSKSPHQKNFEATLIKALSDFRNATRTRISVQELMVLLSIVDCPGRSWAAIQKDFGMTKTVIYRISDVLLGKTKGGALVKVKINPEEKRQRLVTATAKGEKLIARLKSEICIAS